MQNNCFNRDWMKIYGFYSKFIKKIEAGFI